MKNNTDNKTPTTSLSSVVTITYLTPENAKFTAKDGFISMKATLPDENGEMKEQEFERVFLHRVFPFELAEEFISVTDKDNIELGMIKDLTVFEGDDLQILRDELARKYFIIKIRKILSVKEQYGFSYWHTECDEGEFKFTVQDTYRSITKLNSDRLYISDADGNRYEIESIKALDKKSYKKLELYL